VFAVCLNDVYWCVYVEMFSLATLHTEYKYIIDPFAWPTSPVPDPHFLSASLYL
jgi:hypothetical protein